MEENAECDFELRELISSSSKVRLRLRLVQCVKNISWLLIYRNEKYSVDFCTGCLPGVIMSLILNIIDYLHFEINSFSCIWLMN